MSQKAADIEQPIIEPLPSRLEFLFETPLYKAYELRDEDNDWVIALEHMGGTIDAYCIFCDDRSLFKVNSNPYVARNNLEHNWKLRDHRFEINIYCGRNNNHSYRFMFQVQGKSITKIGQYPSIADLSLPLLVKYKRVLSSEKYKEFSRAIGLAAHGVGIGSFVYLRRILEVLIEEAHQQAMKSASWNEEAYFQCRVTEKIELLKGYLPEFMVKHRQVYGIIGSGSV